MDADEDDESGSDEDVEMGSSTLNPKCPILLTVMTNPYTWCARIPFSAHISWPDCDHFKSSACRHSFSKEGLDDYLRSGPRQCPASGCNTIIRKELCQPDKTLQKRIQRLVEYQRRQEAKEQAEEESESGDDSDE